MPSLPIIPSAGPAAATEQLAAALESLHVGQIRFDAHNRLLYSTDASLYQVEPLGVVIPTDIAAATRLVKFCAEKSLPLLPRGGGTSLAGQAVGPSIIIDLSPTCRCLISIDASTRTCQAEPGLSIDELNRQLAATGLFFAPDPATVAQATVGGCIGNNAAGARSIRYGRTSENLAAVDLLLSTGDRVTLAPGAGQQNATALHLATETTRIVRSVATQIRQRFPKTIRRNAGYALDLILNQLDRGLTPAQLDLSGLICGCEGTLGLITVAALKLHPIPTARALAVISFASLESAIDAVAPILQTNPSAVELLDDVVLTAARNNAICSPYVDLLPRAPNQTTDPAAVLYVEYQSEREANSRGVSTKANAYALSPSPGTPGEGWGEGDFEQRKVSSARNHPHPNSLPEYRERGQEVSRPTSDCAGNDTREVLDANFHHLRQILPPTAAINIYHDAPAMNDAWTLRRSGEALLHGLGSHRKPITFVEDNAVPVENLPRFVREFKKIVAAHNTTAAFWAHASVGVLHVRPLLNLHDPADLHRMQSIAQQVAHLARDCGGVMSGEHGDGRARGPLLEQFFGPDLMHAFGQIKQLFDPKNIFNPGNIVAAGPVEQITTHLRIQSEPAHPPRDLDQIDTYFDYTDQQGFRGAVEQCNGAGFCRKTAGGTMCPSYRATLDERHSTRGRGNALRLAITGQSANATGPAWNDPATLETLDLCLSCKACKTECPSNVDIARLKAEYTAQRYKQTGIPLHARVFAHIRTLNQLGSMTPTLANQINRLPPIRAMLNRLLHLAPQRTLPPFAPSLHRWFARHPRPTEDHPKVVLFPDCFTTFNDPHIGQATITLLESLGYQILLPHTACCGRPMISTGLLPQAIRTITQTLQQLEPHANDPAVEAILVAEPSCLSAIKDDWLQLKLPIDLETRRRIAAKAMLPETFIDTHWNHHPHPPALRSSPPPKVLLHAHCHQKSLWGDHTSSNLLRRLLGDNLTVLPTGCCGMAGAFGFTQSHYDLSMKIGELSLFPPIRSASEDIIILAPGTSCRHQIHDATGRKALHPIELAAKLLGAD